ncbi:hypothetical protein [Variovorax sp. JS1663]|uniref:hypothetical protein n=1 Tax=Variovorax sp. JS1663 TaxID=1851577 RepID=UPI000B34A15E|nr:hypothetical protein [Variovorax sp. JS1663]OUM04060.1 hypothetical protein A8M77_03335 [Variovorax sp. JS1663]
MLQASLLAMPASAGTIRTEYDVMGQPIAITDASGQVTRIQRDLLSRPTLITYADGQSSTLVYGVGAHAKGYLSSFTDRSGSTTYTRDIFGCVVTKTQVLASGLRQQVGYGYTAAGQLANKRYDGQYFDKESGLHYNYLRTCCPTCGRYTRSLAAALAQPAVMARLHDAGLVTLLLLVFARVS